MASVKKNFTYSTILTLAGYIFPMITYPYVSRILGVSNVGICSFVDGMIHYFCMFSTLGMSVTGIREIAACGTDKDKRSKTFSSLLVLSGITTIVSVIALLLCIQFVPKFYENRNLMYVGLMKLIFNFTLIEWFYKGIEDFKYITVRSLAVRLLYVVSVFFVVKTANDYDKYYFLTNATIVINAIINLVHSRNFASLSIKNINIRPFISSFIIMGVYNIVSSLYTSFNVVYLGMVSTNTEVGYYSTAQKLYSIIIAIYTAFTSVMMPRMSSLLAKGEFDEFKRYIQKSIDVLFAFAIPVVVFTTIFSSEIILLLSGPGYEGAILPMITIMPLILIIGYEQILVIQILMPMKKDKVIFRNSVIGAVTGITLNLLIVGKLESLGSSIVWLCSELVVLVSAQLYLSHNYGIKFPFAEMAKNISIYLPAGVGCIFVKHIVDNFVISLLLGIVFMVIYFFTVQFAVLKNETVLNYSHSIIRKFINR